ncbi:MAG TPA: hypothetical protein VH040_01895 [Usitatibacter sp.]|jgi:hypothetical protein|nr:hypothetical protein [Usitatibacter sp.]
MISILLAAAAMTASCESAANRELDFWLGQWQVVENGEVTATSTIEAVSGGCAIRETYRQKDGYHGTSLSFHDPVLGKWRQTWIDSTGAVGEFNGTFSEGAMRFEGETHTANGKRVFRRMSLERDADGILQKSLRSMDGATWSPHYEIRYSPVTAR